MSNPTNNPATIYAAGAVSRNPATDELIATYPYQTSAEVEATLGANAAAFLQWRDTPMAERVAAYRRLAATLRDRSETLASIITAEMGKTIGAARAEVEKSAATIEWIAEHARKSSALRALASDEWFTDQMPELNTKDASIQLLGKWLIEIAELDRMNRAEVTAVKSYASRQVDTYRPPYERATVDVPRQCVFAGSTNEAEYLRDQTGNRRYWPIACGGIDVQAISCDRDQLWAEAVARYRQGERWWLEGDEDRLARSEQDERRERDAWEELISTRLGSLVNEPVSVEYVCRHILEIPFEKHNASINKRVVNCLKRAGYARRRVQIGDERPWRYVKN